MEKLKILLFCLMVITMFLCSACTKEKNWIGENPDLTTVYNNHRYQRIDQSLSWRQAEYKCEEAGGHLATITSEKEQEIVYDLLSKDAVFEVYWLGIRQDSDGVMTWITDETMSYTNWAEGEPNGSGPYGQMYMVDSESGGHPGEWDDCYMPDKSRQKTGFICEWDS